MLREITRRSLLPDKSGFAASERGDPVAASISRDGCPGTRNAIIYSCHGGRAAHNRYVHITKPTLQRHDGSPSGRDLKRERFASSRARRSSSGTITGSPRHAGAAPAESRRLPYNAKTSRDIPTSGAAPGRQFTRPRKILQNGSQ